MEMQDLSVFAVMALFLCCPLFPIYLTLKVFNWNQRKKLFLDSWFVYLTSLVSSLLVGIFTLYFNSFRAGWFILVIVNTLAIATTLSWTNKEKKALNIFEEEIEGDFANSKQKTWKTAISVSIITIMTLLVLFYVVSGIGVLIEKINPKPKNSFEIYDI